MTKIKFYADEKTAIFIDASLCCGSVRFNIFAATLLDV